MSPINCPDCKSPIDISEDLFGEALACPHCEHIFQLNKKGKVMRYIPPKGGGGMDKSAIIAISLGSIAVIGGIVALIMTGSEPGPSVATLPPPSPSTSQSKTGANDPGADPAGMGNPGGNPLEDGSMNPLASMAAGSTPIEIPDTPDGTVNTVIGALANGNPRGFWDALPPSYQADITKRISEQFAAEDPDMWDKNIENTLRVINILNTKSEFILNVPMLANTPNQERVSKGLPILSKVLTTLMESDLTNLEALKNPDIGTILGTTGPQVIEDLKQIAALLPAGTVDGFLVGDYSPNAKVVNMAEGVATVEFNTGASNDVRNFVQVEGKWIPQDLATKWTQSMENWDQATAKKQMIQQNPQAIQQQMMVMNTMLSALENANSQAQFDQVSVPIISGLMAARAKAAQNKGQKTAGGMQGPPGMGPAPGRQGAPGQMPQGFDPSKGPPPGMKKRPGSKVAKGRDMQDGPPDMQKRMDN